MLASVTQSKVSIAYRKKNRSVSVKSFENLKDNKTKKYSAKAQSRTKNAVSALVNAETIGRFGENWKKHKKEINLCFVTLTLCANQKHSDLCLKRQALMMFVKEIQRRVGGFSYVWKAERQKNENIHFHLLINKKVNYVLIRKVWNNVMNNLGYLQEYKEKMQKLTQKEYILQRMQFAKKYKQKRFFTKYDINEYKKAYKKGKKEGWSNPNTTDIHSLRFIKNVEAYICKYMQKDNSDKIQGRYWGCSDDLHNVQKFETYVTKQDLVHLYGCKKIEKKYFCVYFVNLQILKKMSFFLMFLLFWQNFYCKMHNLKYSEPKKIYLQT